MNLEESTRKTRSFKMKSREVQKEETGEIIESTIEEEVEDTFEYASKKMKLSQGVKEKVTNFVMESQKDHEEVATCTSSTDQIETPQQQLIEAEEKLLPSEFWIADPVTLAKNLLGKIIVRKIDGQLIKCKIVETEAYGGVEDKGCHAYGGKMTDRTKHLYQKGGHLYVYLIYGISCCMNITASIEGEPTAVLIRAVEIMEGYDFVVSNRNMKNLSKIGRELTNGPGKLCAAMKIDKTHNTVDITQAGELFVADGDNKPFEIVVSKRINIGYAQEYIDKPWRFYIKGNKFVSCKGDVLEVISPFENNVTETPSVPSLLLESLDKFKAPPKSSSRLKKII